MKHILLFIAALFQSVSALAVPDSKPQQSPDVVGNAYGIKSKQLVYSELHYYSTDKKDHFVLYIDENNNEMVEKSIDYRQSYSAPAFTQTDKRNNEWLSVEWLDQQLNIKYQPAFKQSTKEATVNVESPLVVDAGFDYFVRDYWDDLVIGEKIAFNYVAPTRTSLVNLTIEMIDCPVEFHDDKALDVIDKFSCFQIKPSTWLISLFLNPIHLMYSTLDQRLHRFRGLTNINDENGDGFEVDIHYDYL
jgi:hypothetical protein